MRSLLGLSAVLLASQSASAEARSFVAEAPFTLGIQGLYTGNPIEYELSDGRVVERVERVVFRFGAVDLLDHCVESGLIPSRIGWRPIAVWADWKDTGPGYRFYLQKPGAMLDRVAIPPELLRLEIIDSATARRHLLSGDTITGGSETYTAYARLTLTLPTGSGVTTGLATSSDKFRSPPGETVAAYLPGATRFEGNGVWDALEEGAPDSVLSVRFLVGSTRFAYADPYASELAPASGTAAETPSTTP